LFQLPYSLFRLLAYGADLLGRMNTVERKLRAVTLSQALTSGFKLGGRIEMYWGKPEIRINAASRLEIK
jgi:hypothetical protein